MNLHEGHKVIPINDEETLKKENLSINDYIKDYDSFSQNIKNIKNKIENEIKEINTRYEKVDKEVSKSFELKHEKLIKEENDMKDKLQTEVTKIKSKLEEYLTLVNELIRNYERINKGIKALNEEDKEQEHKKLNIIQNLTYISKINKNKKEMDKITKTLMKNLKINFIEDNIKYEEYFFNGFEEKISDNCIKHFLYDKKIIYCLKVDAQIDISNYIDYNKKFKCDWFKPDSSEELNDIIEHFYNNYELYDINQPCWIITYGVETEPKEKKIGGYPIRADGYGHDKGDGNIPGKCNGSGFTAFRKHSCSFANPNYFKKLCNWDSSYKFSIICLQKNIN